MAISISAFKSTKVVCWFLYTISFKKPVKKSTGLRLRLLGGHKPTETTLSSKNSRINVIDEADV